MTSPQTTVITVGYNSAAVIGPMLSSLPKGTPVVVVDNNSTDETLRVVKQTTPDAAMVTTEQNHGFGRACNLGATYAATDFLFFVNPDVVLEPETISALEQAARSLPDFAAANPLIKDAKGRARIKTTSVFPLPDLPAPKRDEISEVAVLSGGALFVTSAAFKNIGGFDPAIFLYHEDHDLARRLAMAGGRLWHIPASVVTHSAGTGTARSPKVAAFKGFHMARSRYYVLSKITPRTALLRTLGPALLGLLLPFNLLSQRRRAKYLGQIRGAWSARSDKGVYRPT